MKHLRSPFIFAVVLALVFITAFVFVAYRKDELRFELTAPSVSLKMEANDK